jgi:hypothetical protein
VKERKVGDREKEDSKETKLGRERVSKREREKKDEQKESHKR